jgi:Domain of unknown function (DUF4394)
MLQIDVPESAPALVWVPAARAVYNLAVDEGGTTVWMRRQALALAAAVLAALALAPSSFGETVYALVSLPESTNGLEQFDSATPGIPSAPVTITGLNAGDVLLGIDFRPATGQLYAVSTQGRMYVINTTTGVATQVNDPLSPPFTPSGTDFGMDVNPVVDRIRVVSDADQNLRLNPAGTLSAIDVALAYNAADTNAGKNPNVVALGYTNNVSGAVSTTLYGIDSNLDVLVTLGSVNGTPTSPNTGQLFTVGSLGVDTTGVAGLDISPSGTAYAVLHTAVGGVGSFFHTINLATGAATLVGAIGGTAFVVDIAVRAGPTAVRMQSLSAVRTARGVSVRWRTASSVDNLGFNVYRERRGQRVRLNRNLIPAGSAVAGRRYSFLDRRPLRSGARYWVQAVASDGSLTWYGPVAARRVG